MPAPAIAPDIEARAIKFLLDDVSVKGLVGDRVDTEMPNPLDLPMIVVFLIVADAIVEDWLYVYTLQVDSWANTKDQARDLAATALRTLHGMPGVREDAVVTDVSDGAVMQWLPDPSTHRPRYVSRVDITAHPL